MNALALARWVAARPALARLILKLGDERGQAMVEYSTITLALLMMAGLFVIRVPVGDKWGNKSVVGLLYEALQTYVCSFYFCLSLLAP